ncbi:MAG: hypothetical protein ACK2UK_09165 [Candidatus Promineifilaceae bacterium]
MPVITLTETQLSAIEATGSSFWRGPAGTGKSLALQERLLRLLRSGEPAYTLMVLVAEPESGQQFELAVQASGLGPYADLTVTTYTKLALDLTTLFWPLVASRAGFSQPYRPPVLLTYDMAQLLMWRLIKGDLDAGAFAGLRLRPQQIISQLLDTLNRAALNRLSLEDAIERQLLAWTGEKERLQHIRLAGRLAQTFRTYCLQHSLLDLSLTIEVFDQQLVGEPAFHRYFSERYRHLLVDNIEEQTPAGQHFVSSLMDLTQTAALVYDEGGGYKRFMGAAPGPATRFQTRCNLVFRFEQRFTSPSQIEALANLVSNKLQQTDLPVVAAQDAIAATADGRYRREMVNALIPRLQDQLARGVPAQEIAVIVPYLDGALRYMLTKALGEAGIPYRFLRRRSSPREEPRVRAWLTWLALAYPQWGILPNSFDVAEALSLCIFGLDPARAQLAATAIYDPAIPALRAVEEVDNNVRERIGIEFLERIEELRLWLGTIEPQKPIDIFLHDLFAQLLSQPRYQPEPDIAGAAVCDWLVRTATRLRDVAPAMGITAAADLGATFIDGIYQGLVTANPPDLGEPPDPQGVTISTIYGYLLAGSPVQIQVWLETAASGWWDIPRQPLSNAFVLAPDRDYDEPWTMADDIAVRNELLSRIIRGLSSRTGKGVIIANSDLDRRGARQDGPLWRALQPVLAAPQANNAASEL